MENDTLKKLLSPIFYLLSGLAGLLTMLISFAKVAGFASAKYSAYELIDFSNGSAESVLELALFPFAKQVSAPFIFTVIAIAFIVFTVLFALTVIVGALMLLRDVMGLDLLGKIRLNAAKVGSLLLRVEVVLLIAVDLMFILCAFLNLYTLEGTMIVGLQPDAGFYVMTGVFALIFILHELYIVKSE